MTALKVLAGVARSVVACGVVACAGDGAQAPAAAPTETSGISPGPASSGANGGREVTPDQNSASQRAVGAAKARPALNGTALQAYDAGQRAFLAGDLQGAKSQFERATAADRSAYQAHYALGVVQERFRANQAAMVAYLAALRVVPDYEPAILAYASLLVRSKRASEAETFLNQKRAELPNSAAVLTGLAEARSALQDSSAAQELAQRALKIDPSFRPAMVTLARDHYRNRRLDLALYALAAILDGYGPENPPRDKNNAEARLLRALIYKEQNRRRAAIEEFRLALEQRPDLIEARLNLAAYYLEAGNATEAAPLLEEALRYDSLNVLAHLNLGDAYRLQGRPEEAIKQLEWVAKADTTLAQPHYNLGLVYMFSTIQGLEETQRLDKAIAALQRFKEMQPRSKAGAGDDVDDLIARAKNKKAVAETMSGGDDEFK